MDKKEQIKKLLKQITDLIEEVLDEEEKVEEISTAGNVGSIGFGSPFPGPQKRRGRRIEYPPEPTRRKKSR